MRIFIYLLLIGSISSAFSQTSIQDQISSVGAVQSQIQQEEQRKREALAQAERDRQRKAEELAQNKLRHEQEMDRSRMAAERARSAQAERERERRQSYVDELRAIEIEERRSSLTMNKARAARSNEFIDRELKRSDAQTDVVKSQADASRNVSEGAKNMMNGIGKGAEKKSFWER